MMGTSDLNRNNEVKFLGLTLASNIDFRLHMKCLAKTLNLNLLMMRTIRPFLDDKGTIDICYTFSIPISYTALSFEVMPAKLIQNQLRFYRNLH